MISAVTGQERQSAVGDCRQGHLVAGGAERGLDLAFLDANGGPSTLPSLDEIEAKHIARVLRILGGNRTRAAKTLGIHRDTLYRKLRQYDIGAA